jgi:predicted metalloprotease with PDZ domain
MNLVIEHRIVVASPETHLAEVEVTVRADGDAALPSPLTLFMPVWTPGSYLVREYARHVEGMSAEAPARVLKVRKNAWLVEPQDGARRVTLRYRVYCNELTVRTSHIDDTHAFFNGAALFLAVEGHEDSPSRVTITAPTGWKVATALEAARSREQAAPGMAFEAPSLDVLVDSPIEIGTHREERFEVLGKPHRLAIWPNAAAATSDVERLIGDTKTILETEASLFGNALPYDAYLFLLHLSPRGRGGLEHKSSSTLLASPSAFTTRDGYLDLLSLVAHEAFHLWNVKRIRPAGLTPYRYQEENYTRLLWWFEGATSYFDWRVLRIAKLCTTTEYLEHLAAEIAYLDATHGRLVHSLEEASFDAWIKLYRPDENSQNSSVSYYRKGELVCALFDLEIRARSEGRASLDRVVGHLWDEYGARGVPVPEGSMGEILAKVAGVPMDDLLDAWVRAPGEIDYAATLAKVGLAVERSSRPEAPEVSLGIRVRNEGGRAVVATAMRGGAGQRAGLDPGDEIVALGGARIEGTSVEAALAGKRAGDSVEALLARDGRTLSRTVTLDPARQDRVKLVAIPDASAAARAAFTAWLGEPHSAWGAP